jgi:hypothetical protein
VPGTRSRACSVGSTRVSHHEYPDHPAFLHPMVLTVYLVLSPAIGLVCHRRLRTKADPRPGGPTLPPLT